MNDIEETLKNGGTIGNSKGEFPIKDFKNQRFKLIPAIKEGPWMVKKVVGSGKPAIIGTKLTQRFFRGNNYLELDLDISSSSVAAGIVSVCRGYASNLDIDLAFCLQGENEEELPEKLLGCYKLSYVNVDDTTELY